MTERGDRVRVMSRTGSALRFVGDLKKVRELKTRRRTSRFDFWGSLRRDEFACRGCRTRMGPDEEASIKRLCLSPCVETFNSQVIKRFRIWTKKPLRLFEFRDSYVIYMFYCYEYYMSIPHMALIVAIVQSCIIISVLFSTTDSGLFIDYYHCQTLLFWITFPTHLCIPFGLFSHICRIIFFISLTKLLTFAIQCNWSLFLYF